MNYNRIKFKIYSPEQIRDVAIMREHFHFSISETQKQFQRMYRQNPPSKSTIYRWEKNGYQYEFMKRKELFKKILLKLKPGKNAKAKDWEKWKNFYKKAMGS